MWRWRSATLQCSAPGSPPPASALHLWLLAGLCEEQNTEIFWKKKCNFLTANGNIHSTSIWSTLKCSSELWLSCKHGSGSCKWTMVWFAYSVDANGLSLEQNEEVNQREEVNPRPKWTKERTWHGTTTKLILRSSLAREKSLEKVSWGKWGGAGAFSSRIRGPNQPTVKESLVCFQMCSLKVNQTKRR